MLAFAASVAACGDPSGTVDSPAHRDIVTLHFNAPAPYEWTASGQPVYMSNRNFDVTREWATLASATVNQSVTITHFVLANRPTDASGGFSWLVHPAIDRAGVFRPGDRPQVQLPSFSDCADNLRLALGRPDSVVQAYLDAVPDSVTITVSEYGPRFGQHVDMIGEVDVSRDSLR